MSHDGRWGAIDLERLLTMEYSTLRTTISELIATRHFQPTANIGPTADQFRRHCNIAMRKRRLGSRAMHLRRFRCKRPFDVVLADIFLTSRLGGLNASFLHLQEGATADFRARKISGVGVAFDLLSQRLGRRPITGFNLSLKFGRYTLFKGSIDPFPHLRALYGATLRGKPPRGGMSLHRFSYRVKARLIERVLRHGMDKLARRPSQLDLVTFPWYRSAMVWIMELHKPGAARDRMLAAEITAQVTPFLADFGTRLIRTFGTHPESLAKFLKMVLAVIVWRAFAFRSPDTVSGSSADDKELSKIYMIETIRLALAWGSMYPLVDDVLDDQATTSTDRHRISEVINAFVVGTDPTTTNLSQATKVVLLSEAFGLIAAATSVDLERTRKAVGLVAQSHLLESAKCLTLLQPTPEEELEVCADTFLKSFLVRLATMILCGIQTTSADLVHGMDVALFNQLGDDLCDLSEDLEQQRVTPFTLFHAANVTLDPYRLYLGCVEDLGVQERGGLGVAALYSCLETMATAWSRQPGRVRLMMEPHLARLAEALGWAEDLREPAGIFYIDPDTILVQACEALLAFNSTERHSTV